MADLRGYSLIAGFPVWHMGNMGSGSGLDSDSTDGYHLNQGLQTTDSPTFTNIYTTGKIGLGTSSPIAPMDIKLGNSEAINTAASTVPNGNLAVGSPGTSGVLTFGVNTGSYAWVQYTHRSDASASFPLVLNPVGGNVGVGTTTPQDKLNINGGGIQVGLNTDSYYSTLSNNNISFHRNGISYIEQATVGGSLYFRVSKAASADTNALVIDNNGEAIFYDQVTANRFVTNNSDNWSQFIRNNASAAALYVNQVTTTGDIAQFTTGSATPGDTANYVVSIKAGGVVQATGDYKFKSTAAHTYGAGDIMVAPTTSTWARGIFYRKSDDNTAMGAIGMYANGDTATSLFFGFGSSPWSSYALSLASNNDATLTGNVTISQDKYLYLASGATNKYLANVGGIVTLLSPSNIQITADSDSSTTTEYASIKAGPNELKITSSGASANNNNITFNGYVVANSYNTYNKTDIETFRDETFDNYTVTGGTVSYDASAAFKVSIATGTFYIGGKRFTPAATSLTFAAASTNHVYVDNSGNITSTTGSFGFGADYAYLADVVIGSNISSTAPPAAPSLTTTTTGGNLAPATYYISYTWVTDTGSKETTMGTENSIKVPTGTSTNVVNVVIPAFPTGATQANIYMCSTSGGTKYKVGSTTTTAGATVTITATSTTGIAPTFTITDARNIITNSYGAYTYNIYSSGYAQTINQRGSGSAFLIQDAGTNKFIIDGSGNLMLENGADFYAYSDEGSTQKFFIDGVTGNTSIAGTLGVTGAATLSSTLAVSGAATLSSTLGVTGAATLSSTLAVSGASTHTGLATFNGNIKIASNGEIQSAYNSSYIIKDHGNGHVTLSAAGGDLYLGYQNTTNVRLSKHLTTSDGVTEIISTTGAVTASGLSVTGTATTANLNVGRNGIYGTYDSSQVQQIWSIGSSWSVSTANNNFGTLYGLGYAYNTVGGGKLSNEHQLILAANGTVGMALGFSGNAWMGGGLTLVGELSSSGNIHAPKYILSTSTGNTWIEAGSGDGGTTGTHNLRISSWYGIGFYNLCNSNCSIAMDVRNGITYSTQFTAEGNHSTWFKDSNLSLGTGSCNLSTNGSNYTFLDSTIVFRPPSSVAASYVYIGNYGVNSGGTQNEAAVIPNNAAYGSCGSDSYWWYKVSYTLLQNKSSRATKYEVFDYDNNLAYEEVKNLKTYAYRHISFPEPDDEHPEGKLYRGDLQIGIMAEDAPMGVVVHNTEGSDGSSIDPYALVTVVASAMQVSIGKQEVLEEEVEVLKDEIVKLETENDNLKNKVEMMENTVSDLTTLLRETLDRVEKLEHAINT